MSLSNLKAKRTRYKNILQQYLTTGKNLLAIQTGSIDLDSFVEEIEKSIRNINSDKLDAACAELSIEARNQNRDEDYEQFI